MLKRIIICTFLIICANLHAQVTAGFHRVNQVLGRGNGVQAVIVPNATVIVTSTATGLAATIYSNPGLTSLIIPSVVTADSRGNYSYYLPLNYCVTEKISSPGQDNVVIVNICSNSTGGGGAVASVFGRTGIVVAAANDYSFSQLSGSPTIAQIASAGTLTNNTSGTSAGLSGTPALPNGTTATTQTTGDNTTKIATDAFVIANAAAGIPSITLTSAATGAITFAGAGVAQSGSTFTFSGAGSGIGSIAWSIPTWLTATPPTISASGTQIFTPTTGQISHRVIGTCGSATSFAPCALVAGDLPAIPFTGLSGNLGITQGPSSLTGLLFDTAGTLTIKTINGAGAGLVSGPATATATDIPVYTSTTGGTVDSGIAITTLAPKASPALTGTPTTPTATVGTNTTQIASTAFVLANATGNPSVGASQAVQMAGATTGTFADSGCTADGSGNQICHSNGTTGSTQGLTGFGVGTGTITLPGNFPTNYVGIIGPPSGTPAFFLQLPSVAPSGGQQLSFATPSAVNGQSQSVGTWVPIPTRCTSTASPAVCVAATSGIVQVAAAATTLTINSTAITANTGCWFTYDVGGITPPVNMISLLIPYISGRTAGTSISITLPVAPTTNPVNIQFDCTN